MVLIMILRIIDEPRQIYLFIRVMGNLLKGLVR